MSKKKEGKKIKKVKVQELTSKELKNLYGGSLKGYTPNATNIA